MTPHRKKKRHEAMRVTGFTGQIIVFEAMPFRRSFVMVYGRSVTWAMGLMKMNCTPSLNTCLKCPLCWNATWMSRKIHHWLSGRFTADGYRGFAGWIQVG